MNPLEPTRREAGAVLLAIALLAMALVVRNGWAQDDVDLIAGNGAIQQLSGLWSGFTSPWWPPPWTSGLYRPLARSLLTIEWALGGGAPWVIHLTSLLLYGASVIALWRVAELLLSPGAAWGAAALFAVHPVHVEAVALGVNQGELVVAALAAVALRELILIRRGLRAPGLGWTWILLSITIALGFKEHAAMIPLLLLAAEALPLKGGTGDSGWRRWGGYVAAFLIVALFWSVGTGVLDGLGVPPSEGLAGAGIGARALTMLGVVPTWARLLLWPLSLQADYSPMEIVPWAGWTMAQSVGTLLIVGWCGLLWWALRRAPVLAYGGVATMIALLPVSNVLLPTGVLVAERTLFLASVGVVLMAGAAMERVIPQLGKGMRRGMIGAGTLVIAAGAVRSAARLPVWHDQATHITAQLLDAPRSYRAQMAFGVMRYEIAGDRQGGERHLREAIALWPSDPLPYQELADRYRADGLCRPAVAVYGEALRIAPARDDLRAGMVACLIHDGRWEEAAAASRTDLPLAVNRPWFDGVAALADSARRSGAAPGAVAVPALPGGMTAIGIRRGW